MKILLITTPRIETNTRWSKPKAHPPRGLCHIASVLEQSRYSVEILDAFAKNMSIDEIQKEIKRCKPTIVGISLSFAVFFNNAKLLSEAIKEVDPKIITVIGGAHLFLNYLETMIKMPSVDFAVRGEGEFAFLELIKCLENNGDLSVIEGLVYRRNKKLKINQPRKWIENLDILPLPSWHLIGMNDKGYGAAFRCKQSPMTAVVTSRGCPNACIFCDRVFGKKYRAHSAEYIIKEIKYLIHNYKIKEIYFSDDNFLIDVERVKKLCRLLKQENINLSWSCQGRVDTIANHPEIIKIIKDAGCWYIALGIESGNEKVLKYLQKNITLKQVKQAVDILHKNGIMSKGYFMIGHPIDTKETINDTINFAKSLKLDTVQFSFTVPYPGTELYSIALDTGEFDKDAYELLSGHSNVPIYVPFGLTKNELIKLQKKAYRSFYFRPTYILHQIKNIRNLTMFKNYIFMGTVYVKKLFLKKE